MSSGMRLSTHPLEKSKLKKIKIDDQDPQSDSTCPTSRAMWGIGLDFFCVATQRDCVYKELLVAA